MERGTPFVEGEIYHLYTRGVEKRRVFLDEHDSNRFVALLFGCNNKNSIRISNLSRRTFEQGESLLNALIRRTTAREYLVDILAYALMPNHVHLVVRERRKSGISAFMHKIMTAYSMYFNTRNERSGPLFTRPFRSRHVDSDAYFRWLFAYVHLNPLEILLPSWKEQGVSDMKQAVAHMQNYRYSSYPDYFMSNRPESLILSKENLPLDIGEVRIIDDLLAIFSEPPEDIKTLIY